MKAYQANTNQKQVGIVIVVSDKADYRTMKIIRVKKGYYTINGSVLQICITILNLNGLSNYQKV